MCCGKNEMKLLENNNQFIVKAGSAVALADRLIETFGRELRRLSPSELNVSGGTVSFRAGVFRLVSNWNLLVPISRGEIVVAPANDGVSVRYTISFRQLVTVATIMIVIMMVMICSSEGSQALPLAVFGGSIMWLWLVGMNLAIAIPRFRRFVRKCVESAGATEIKQIAEQQGGGYSLPTARSAQPTP